MEDTTSNLALLEKIMEIGQSRGAFDLNIARIMFISLFLLKQNEITTIRDRDDKLDRVKAAENLKHGLDAVQKKGNIIGDIQTGIRLKQALDSVIQSEKQAQDAQKDSKQSVRTLDASQITNFTLQGEEGMAKAVTRLRNLAEEGQRSGVIMLDKLQAIDGSLRIWETPDTTTELRQQALNFLATLCHELQLAGGNNKSLADAYEVVAALLFMTSSMNDNAEPEHPASEDDAMDEMETSDVKGKRAAKRARA